LPSSTGQRCRDGMSNAAGRVDVTLDDLVAFAEDAAKAFLRQRLGVTDRHRPDWAPVPSGPSWHSVELNPPAPLSVRTRANPECPDQRHGSRRQGDGGYGSGHRRAVPAARCRGRVAGFTGDLNAAGSAENQDHTALVLTTSSSLPPDESRSSPARRGWTGKSPAGDELHPFITHYQGPACKSTGTTGDWNAATGSSQGWSEWSVDLSAYARQQVEVSIAYVSDWAILPASPNRCAWHAEPPQRRPL
jgi:hypothetical protein